MAKDCNNKQKIPRTFTPSRSIQKAAALQNPHECELNCDESNDGSSFSLPNSTEVTTNEVMPCPNQPHMGSACILTNKLLKCCVTDGQVKLACGHILPVLGGVCKVCENMPVQMGYVGGNLIKVLRDTGCSGVVVKRDLVTDDQLTGEVQRCVLIDGTVRNVEEASIYVDTPYFTGNVKAFCMKEPVYDLILGNIDGVRNQNDPDLQWCKIEERNDCSHVLQAVQTRAQKKKENQGMKKLNVTGLVDADLTLNQMKQLQMEDTSLNVYHEHAASGRKKRSVITLRLGLASIEDCCTDTIIQQRLVIQNIISNFLFQNLYERKS